MIMGVVLAGGQSKRMGDAKQLLNWQGVPMIRWVLARVMESDFSPVRVVLGAYAPEIRPLIHDLGAEQVFNPDYARGQSTSLRAGLRDWPRGTLGAAFILADQPLVKHETYNFLYQTFIDQQPGVLVPLYQGKRGNPVIFHRKFFPQLLEITGDKGGREILKNYPNEVLAIEVEDPGIVRDIDFYQDYINLKKEAIGDEN